MRLYDFKTGWEIREKDIDLFLINEWLWRSQERSRKKATPFALNDLESF